MPTLAPFLAEPLVCLLYASPLQNMRRFLIYSVCLQPFSLGLLFKYQIKKRWEEVLIFFFTSDISFQVRIIHLFMCAFTNKYLSAKCMPGTVLGIGCRAINQTKTALTEIIHQ